MRIVDLDNKFVEIMAVELILQVSGTRNGFVHSMI